MKNKKKITYQNWQQLAKITEKGTKNYVLKYAKEIAEFFPEGFISLPGKRDITNFSRSEPKSIEWTFDSDVYVIRDVEIVKEKLEEQKNKLIERIHYLEHNIKNLRGAHPEKDELLRLKHFSFDWENPQKKVCSIDTDLGIAIFDWGLCNPSGVIIPPPELINCELLNGEVKVLTEKECRAQGGKILKEPPPSPPELIKCELPNGDVKELTDDECLTQGGKILKEPPPSPPELIKCELPNGDVKELTEDECLAQGGKILKEPPPSLPELIKCELPNGEIKKLTEEECLAQGGKPVEKDDWWKKWVIGLGILILLLLVKNCNPRANIKVTEYQDRYVFDEFKSHDSASFFQRGFLLKETPSNHLKTYWKIFKKNKDDNYDLFYTSQSQSRITLDKQLGKFLINLKVEDKGNKLGFLKKADSISYLIEINKVFSDLHSYDTIYVVDYLMDDGVPFESSFDTLKSELTIPMPTNAEDIKGKIFDQQDKIDGMEEEGADPEEIEKEKEKLDVLEKAYKDKTDDKVDDPSDDIFDAMKEQNDKIDEMEEEGADPGEIEKEKEKLDELIDDAMKEQNDKIDEMEKKGADQQEIDKEKDKLDQLGHIDERMDKEDEMEEKGADPEEKEKLDELIEDLSTESRVGLRPGQSRRGSLLDRAEEMIEEGEHKGWMIIVIEERDCLDCAWRLKDSYFEDKFGIRHEKLLPVSIL